MNLYNDASLAMIPSAYKDGKLYSIKPTDGSGDFTFSRGSNLAATRVDVNGLIEKGRENLLLQSNSFDELPPWGYNTYTVTGGQLGYDGTNNAWLIDKQDIGNSYITQVGLGFNGVFTISIYAKAGSLNKFMLYTDGKYVVYDLQNGTSQASGAVIYHSIDYVGNGYYRCWFTGLNTNVVYIQPKASDGGFASGSIYIQDAQLEVGLVATDYIETTTTTAQAGILEDMPRLDYSGGASCPSLLLEPTRTNLIPHSEYFESWQFISEVNLTSNTDETTSPEGVYNATKMVENISSNPHRVFVVQTGTNNMLSFFAKAGERDWVNVLTNSGGYVYFNVSTGEKGTQASGSPTTIEDYGNGWYRCSVYNFHNTYALIGVSPSDGTLSYTGDGTSGVYIYGAQVEASATYPTSYIPCYGAATTRSADTCFNSTDDFAGTDQVTLFAELDNNGNDRSGSFFRFNLNQGTSTAEWIFLGYESTNSVRFYVRSNSSTSVDISAGNYGAGVLKMAAKIDSEGNYKLFANGVQISSGSNAVFSSSLNRVNIGQTNGITNMEDRVKQLAIFPTALTDSECIALTTI